MGGRKFWKNISDFSSCKKEKISYNKNRTNVLPHYNHGFGEIRAGRV
jgi:hypothetical protein